MCVVCSESIASEQFLILVFKLNSFQLLFGEKNEIVLRFGKEGCGT